MKLKQIVIDNCKGLRTYEHNKNLKFTFETSKGDISVSWQDGKVYISGSDRLGIDPSASNAIEVLLIDK